MAGPKKSSGFASFPLTPQGPVTGLIRVVLLTGLQLFGLGLLLVAALLTWLWPKKR